MKIDFLSMRKYSFIISIATILIGFVLYSTRGGIKYGIDFSGGSQVRVRFNQTVNLETLEKILNTKEKSNIQITELAEDGLEFLIKVYLSNRNIHEAYLKKTTQKVLLDKIKQTFEGLEIQKIDYKDNAVSIRMRDKSQEISKESLKEVLKTGFQISIKHDSKKKETWITIRSSIYELALKKEVIIPLIEKYKDLEITNNINYSPTQGSILKVQSVGISLVVLVLILLYIGLRFQFSFGVASLSRLSP